MKKTKVSVKKCVKKKEKQILHTELAMLILVVAAFFFFVAYLGSVDEGIMYNDAEILLEVTVIEDNLDLASISKILLDDYEQVKEQLGLENDFVIYLEDASGNVITVETEGKDFSCIGRPYVNVKGNACV